MAIVAGLRGAFAKDEAERLRTWLLEDGNLLLAASPILGGADRRVLPEPLRRSCPPGSSACSVRSGSRSTTTSSPSRRPDVALPGSGGFRFVAQPRQHPVTTALVKSDRSRDVPRVVVYLARSMRRATEPGSRESAGAARRRRRARSACAASRAPRNGRTPRRSAPAISRGRSPSRWRPSDRRSSPASPHGPRIVVVGSGERAVRRSVPRAACVSRRRAPRRERDLVARVEAAGARRPREGGRGGRHARQRGVARLDPSLRRALHAGHRCAPRLSPSRSSVAPAKGAGAKGGAKGGAKERKGRKKAG